MIKKCDIIGIMVGFSLLLSACSTQPQTTATVETIPAQDLTAVMEPTEGAQYATTLELNFDRPDDLNWVEFDRPENTTISSTDVLKDGVFRMGDGVIITQFTLRPTITPGSIVHTQVRVSPNVCYPVQLDMNGDFQQEGEMLVRMGGCINDPVGAEIVRNHPDQSSLFGKLGINGNALISPDEWVDMIFWLHPDGDRVIYLTSNSLGLSYGSVSLPGEWQTDDALLRMGVWADLTTDHLDIGMIRLSEGSLPDYLAANLPNYLKNQEKVDGFLQEEPQSFPELQSQDEQPGGYDPFGIVAEWLQDPQEVFGENAEAMAENDGGQFGPGAVKEYNAQENVFSFKDENAVIWTPLNTLLDQFGGVDVGGNQAILVKFQPLPPFSLSYTLMGGSREFSVDFSQGIQVKRMEGIEDFNGSLRMEEGGWYYILMAMSGDGSFRSLVWKDGEPQSIASYIGDFGSDYANSSWKFIIGSTAPMTLNIAEYHVLTFSGFSQ